MADQTDEARARGRFLVISVMRLFGIAMVLLAIAIARDAVDLPNWTAFVLLPLGLVEAFFMPLVLARMWRTQDQSPPRP
jgi:hypothetical protein